MQHIQITVPGYITKTLNSFVDVSEIIYELTEKVNYTKISVQNHFIHKFQNIY